MVAEGDQTALVERGPVGAARPPQYITAVRGTLHLPMGLGLGLRVSAAVKVQPQVYPAEVTREKVQNGPRAQVVQHNAETRRLHCRSLPPRRGRSKRLRERLLNLLPSRGHWPRVLLGFKPTDCDMAQRVGPGCPKTPGLMHKRNFDILRIMIGASKTANTPTLVPREGTIDLLTGRTICLWTTIPHTLHVNGGLRPGGGAVIEGAEEEAGGTSLIIPNI